MSKAKVVRKKVGQVWRLNRYNYPLSSGTYTIVALDTDRWGSNIAKVRPAGRSSDSDRIIDRRGMTTARGLWTYMGMSDDKPAPWVYSCISCGSKQISMALGPSRRERCDVCGGWAQP